VTDEVDAGAVALAACLKLRGRAITIDELKRMAGGPAILSPSDMVVAAGKAGFKAKIRKTGFERLSRLPMPLIAMTRDGGFLLVAQVAGDRLVVRDPLAPDLTELSAEAFQARWSGHVILVAPSRWEEATSQFSLAWFLPRLLKHRLLLSEVLASALFLQLFALVTPLFTMVIIDKVLSVGRSQTLDVLIIGLTVITLFEFVIGTLRRTLSHHMTKRVDAELVAGLFHHMTHLPMAFFATRQTGDTVARVRELEGIRAFLTGPALTAVVDLPFAIVFFVCMGLFSPVLTAVAMVAFLLVLGLHGLAAPALRERLQKKMKSAADSQSFLVEVVTGMETLKALAIEPQMQRAWEEQVVTQSEISGHTEHLTSTVSQIAGLVQKMTIAATLWIGANMVIEGALTPGQLIAFNMLVGRALAPAMRIAQLFQQIHQTRVSVKRLAEILNAKTEPKAASGNLPAIEGKVSFDHVTFRYANDGPAAVEDITLGSKPN
jgi:subfamily B ATP-binding cassette protein HlyB/CyaB